MITSLEKTIGQIVAEDYRSAEVFNKFNIDFCYNGNKKLAEVCKENNINTEIILSELNQSLQNNKNKTHDYNSWPLDLLTDYIEKTHHKYIEQKTPEIKQLLHKLCDVHGRNHPELFEVKKLFDQSAGQLAMHMKKEELILFPFIRKMVAAKQKNEKITPPGFGSIKNPIQAMMNEHDVEGDRFKDIASLTNNYSVPEDGCNTYQYTFLTLKEFEDDLHLHIHLENNILFPKSIELENELFV